MAAQAKQAAGDTAEENREFAEDPNSFSAFMKQRNQQKKQQELAIAALRDEATTLLAMMISTPKEPSLHLKLSITYLQLGRKDEAVESLGKALKFLLTTHPSAETELEALRHAPALLEAALLGRGQADWATEEVVARNLIKLAEKIGPQHAALGADDALVCISAARRAFAGYLARNGKRAACIEQLKLADETIRPARDLVSLMRIPDEAMHLAHEVQAGPERAGHVVFAVEAARDALATALAARGEVEALVLLQARFLLARTLYGRLLISQAPEQPVKDRTVVSEALPSDSWSDSLKVQGTDADAMEAYRLAGEIQSEAKRLNNHIYVELGSMLQDRLQAAGLARDVGTGSGDDDAGGLGSLEAKAEAIDLEAAD